MIRNTVWESDVSLFENSAAVAPRSAKNHYNLGYIRAENARFREGLEAYRRATEIYPKYWDAWTGRARCERELGMLAEAKRSCERSLEALPTFENGFFCLGLVAEAMGKDREAVEAYRSGLVKNPASLPLAFRAATVESQLGDPQAGDSWRRALKAHPASLSTRFGYAKWLRAQGDREGSLAELRRILRAAPRDIAALRLLAEEQEEAGRLLSAALARKRAARSVATLAAREEIGIPPHPTPTPRRGEGSGTQPGPASPQPRVARRWRRRLMTARRRAARSATRGCLRWKSARTVRIAT